MNVRLASAPITRVATDAFTQELLDDRFEGIVFIEFLVGEGDACGLQAAGQRGGVVDFWVGHLLELEARGPVGGGDFGLVDAFWGDEGIGPG